MSKILTTKDNKILIDTNKKIYTIKGSLSDGATIKSGGWQGTNVVGGEYVEKLYFNTNLSVEEVNAICDKLTFTDGLYVILSTDISNSIFILDFRDVDGGIAIFVNLNNYNGLVFNTSPVLAENYQVNLINGWVENLTNDYAFLIDGYVMEKFEPDEEMSVDINPNNTSQLISTTPFTQAEEIILSGTYDGSPIETSESEVNVKELINAKQIPLNIKFSGGNGGSGEQVRSLKKYLDTKKSCYDMFSNNSSLTSKELADILEYNDTENVKNIEFMFYACTSLTSIPLINMTNVKYMSNAFGECEALQKLHIEKLTGTELTEGAQSTFAYCYELTKLEIDSFEADWIDYCFSYCYSLRTLIIRDFTIDPSEIYGEEVFEGCYHFDGTQDDDYNPDEDMDGYIYVPRKYINSLSNSEVFSPYADQIRALEDYTVDGTTTGELDENKINE